MSQMDNAPEIEMDVTALTREEVYTDGKIGSIRKLTPVTHDGEQDASRHRVVLYHCHSRLKPKHWKVQSPVLVMQQKLQ